MFKKLDAVGCILNLTAIFLAAPTRKKAPRTVLPVPSHTYVSRSTERRKPRRRRPMFFGTDKVRLSKSPWKYLGRNFRSRNIQVVRVLDILGPLICPCLMEAGVCPAMKMRAGLSKLLPLSPKLANLSQEQHLAAWHKIIGVYTRYTP